MAKFNIMDLMQTPPPTQSHTEESFPIEYIHIDEIIPSDKNFYNVEDVEELANSILLCGLEHNLSVERDDDGRNILISGHRRRLALKKLVSEGHPEFALAPCRVVKKQDDTLSELRLVLANSTARVLSDYEKIQQAQKLKELLTKLKQGGEKLPGRLRDIIAGTMNVSATKVAQMETINKNLPEEHKEDFKAGKINFSTALELSQGKGKNTPKAEQPNTESIKPHEGVTKLYTEQVEEPPKQIVYEYMQSLDIDKLVKFLYINSRHTGLGIKRLREWLEGEVKTDG